MKGVTGVLLVPTVLLLYLLNCVHVDSHWTNTEWTNATATYYGEADGKGTYGGACGFGDLDRTGYYYSTAALSTALFNNGLTCGGCFKLKCRRSESGWCHSDDKEITITATNHCPEGSEGGWCNYQHEHFDLTQPMFRELAEPKAGVVPIMYERVPCVKNGGVKFELTGNHYWSDFLVFNVAGRGTVCEVHVKGEKTQYYEMTHLWGQRWVLDEIILEGQALSFMIRICEGEKYEFVNVVPRSWEFNHVYEAATNCPSF